MLKKRIRQIGHGLLCAAFACGLLSGQMTVTGTISGTVVDPSGQVIAGARITLTSVRTSDTRRGRQEKAASGNGGLIASQRELEEFKAKYARPRFVPAAFRRGDRVQAFIGLDGGSTSTKAVLLSEHGEVLSKAYQLSNGNAIQDTINLFENLRQQVEMQGAIHTSPEQTRDRGRSPGSPRENPIWPA